MSHPVLAETAHRPWPLPARSWSVGMVWEDLLFAHWPVDPAALRPLVPPALELETFDGAAWLGVVPFRMSGVRPRSLPALPGATAFPELNVRTYVCAGERPGVWFFSLDAASALAVRAARWAWRLPYFDAAMRCEVRGGDADAADAAVRYGSRRTHRGAWPATFRARYGPDGPPRRTGWGSLEHWLTERYCLYAQDRRGHLLRGEIHHAPWPLQPAWAELEECTMADQLHLALPDEKPRLSFARRLEVLAWTPERVAEPVPTRRRQRASRPPLVMPA